MKKRSDTSGVPQGENGGLPQGRTHHHHPAPDFRWAYRLIKVNKFWIFSTLIFSASLALFAHIFEKNSYVSTSILSLGSRDHMNPISESMGLTSGDNFVPKVSALVEQFKSQETCKSLVSDVNAALQRRDISTAIPAELDEAVCGSLSFEPDAERLQIRILSRINDPKLSQLIADQAANMFVEKDQKRLRRRVSELKRFLSVQEKELGRQLRQIETEKTLFQANSSIISVNQAERSIMEGLEKGERDYLELQIQLKNNDNLIQQSKNSLRDLKKALVSNDGSMSSLYLNQIQYRLNMLQYRKSMTKNDNDPEAIRKADTEIAQIMKVYQQVLDGKGDTSLIAGDPLEYLKSLKASFASLIKDRDRMKDQAAALENNIKKRGFDLKELAANMQRLGELNRENEIANNLYLVIKKRLQEIQIEEAAAVSDFAVLSPATIGATENSTLSRKLLFYIGIGLFSCLALLFIQDSMIPSVKDLSDLEQLGINPMGYIPLVPLNPLAKMPLLLKEYPDSLESDSFRALRVRLQAFKNLTTGHDQALVLLITSPGPGVGKTFVSANLASAFSKGNLKTLLVDFDFRQPSIKKFFESENIHGKLNKSISADEIESCIEKYDDNLDILAAHSTIEHSAEFIERIKLPDVLSKLSAKYDFIIFDTPPILSVIDAFLISTVADLHLLVVQHRKTHREDIINSVETLSDLKSVPILGLMNKAHPDIVFADGGRYYKVITPKSRTAAS